MEVTGLLIAKTTSNIEVLCLIWMVLDVGGTKNGGEGGIRTHVPVTRQDAFEAPPLRPLRYLSLHFGAANNRSRKSQQGYRDLRRSAKNV